MAEDHYSMLCSFLTGLLGVSELSETIKKNIKEHAITLRQLRLLNDQDLTELGFRMGEKRALLDWISRTSGTTSSTTPSTPAPSLSTPTTPSTSANSARSSTPRAAARHSFQSCDIDELLTRRSQGKGKVNGGSLAQKLRDGTMPDIQERQFLVQTVGRFLMNNCTVTNKPSPAEKQEICKAIITTFPVLNDGSPTGYDCFFDKKAYTGWLEWYCRSRRANCNDIETQWVNSSNDRSQPLTDDIITAERQLSEQRPNVTNRHQLLTLMQLTRTSRREWIIKERPSITEILRRYPRLMDINETIRQEFCDVAKTRVQLLESWQRYKELILQLAASNAGMQHLLDGIAEMDEDKKSEVAFVCLVHLLPSPPRKGVKVPRRSPEFSVSQFFQDLEDDTVDSAVSRLTRDGLTQPVLLRVQSCYYVKCDNTAVLISDCSCFAEAAEFLFMCFHVFSVCYPPSLSKFFQFFERVLSVHGSSRKLFEFFRRLESQ